MNEKCRKAIKTGRESLLNYNLLHKDGNNVQFKILRKTVKCKYSTVPFHNEQHISMNDWITYMML